jgi:hypothetical protein
MDILAAVTLMAVLHVGSQVAQVESPAPPSASIKIDDPKDVADVRALNELVNTLSRHVTACVNGGGEPATCGCRFPDDVASLRAGYQTAIKGHPHWKDQMLLYEFLDNGRKISGALYMQTLRRQLESLQCV